MKLITNIMLYALLFSATSACSKSKGSVELGNGNEAESQYVKGRVLDEAGKPVKNVKVIIEDMIVYSEAITAVTDENGYYKAKLGVGPYRVAYGEITRTLEGRTFAMRVHSNDRNVFTDVEGAVRDLTWKLSGPTEPDSPTHYGGDVQMYYVNGGVNFDYITFTFEPIELINGSKPPAFTRKVTNGYYIPDIPIGKYKITGTYQEPTQSSASTLDFRDIAANPNGQFSVGGIIATFYPGPDPGNCTNCIKLEFQ
jgi:hypothetical protein